MAKRPATSKLALAAIVAATKGTTGYLYATEADAKPFIDAGHAEMNKDVINPDNASEFAVRATGEGINAVDNPNGVQPNQIEEESAFAFAEIDTPERRARGPGTGERYPFSQLPAPVNGKSRAFFVPATEKMPEPAKSLQSAVSAASRRYATKVGESDYTKPDGTPGKRARYEFERKFAVTPGEHNGAKGAWVARTK